VIYAHMQAVGMVNDHVIDCFRHREVRRLGPLTHESRFRRDGVDGLGAVGLVVSATPAVDRRVAGRSRTNRGDRLRARAGSVTDSRSTLANGYRKQRRSSAARQRDAARP
jgi:hypothetical protein